VAGNVGVTDSSVGVTDLIPLYCRLPRSTNQLMAPDALDDNVPDVHDEADFDIPDTQAVLKRGSASMDMLMKY
jgi:hypothetical protein